MKFCELAANAPKPVDWVWIDTCCIDKKNSVELSEAINSMYTWYTQAQYRYVYLPEALGPRNKPNTDLQRSKFRQSQWFKRGWTLQELSASHELQFFDANWSYIGSKVTLKEHISCATGIKQNHLFEPRTANIATKMSRVASRSTSRAEDIAYCLLGIFHVNMPLLYGEGRKAFTRLQTEIIKASEDESIFAWASSEKNTGILATSPKCFSKSSNISDPTDLTVERQPYYITNKGLQLEVSYYRPVLDVFRLGRGLPVGTELDFRINCFEGSNSKPLVIRMVKTSGQGWKRLDSSKLETSRSKLPDAKSSDPSGNARFVTIYAAIWEA